MKKVLLIVSLLSIASIASAQSLGVGVELDSFNPKAGSVVQSSSLVPSIKLNDTFVVDVKMTTNRADQVNTYSDELRVRANTSLYGVQLFARAGLGKLFPNGTSVTYFTLEVGDHYTLTKNLALCTAYRYSDSIDGLGKNKVSKAFIGGEYSLTAKDLVGLSLYKKTGDVRGDGIQLTYNRAL